MTRLTRRDVKYFQKRHGPDAGSNAPKQLQQCVYADEGEILTVDRAQYLGQSLSNSSVDSPFVDIQDTHYFKTETGAYFAVRRKRALVPYSPAMFSMIFNGHFQIMALLFAWTLTPLVLLLPIIALVQFYDQSTEQAERIGDVGDYVTELDSDTPFALYRHLTSGNDELVFQHQAIDLFYSTKHDFYYTLLQGGGARLFQQENKLIEFLHSVEALDSQDIKVAADGIQRIDSPDEPFERLARQPTPF